MTIHAIQQHKAQLDGLFQLTRNVANDAQISPPVADRLQANLTQYLCVRVSGFIEFAVRQVYYEHARLRGSPSLANYVSKTLERQPGPTADYLYTLAGQFNSQ